MFASSLCAKEVERTSEEIGSRIEAVHNLERCAVLEGLVIPMAPAVPTLYIAIDGTGVPVVPSETKGRKGKDETGIAKTREAKLGAIFTQTTVGQRLKHSGMRWTVYGANSIIALRCCQISGRWEEFWENRAAG